MERMKERGAPGEEDLLAAVLEQMNDAFVGIDEAGCVTAFNGSAERLWGRNRGDVLGNPASSQLPLLWAAIQSHDGAPQELAIQRPDGGVVFVEALVSRIFARGAPLILVTVRDMSQAAAIRQELDFHELVSGETERVVIVTDADRHLVHVNKAFTRMFGYSRGDVMGRHAHEVFAERHAPVELMRQLGQRLDEGKGFNEQCVIRDAGGREIRVQFAITPIFDAAGRLRNVVGLISNVSESRQIQDVQREVLQALAGDLPVEGVMQLICERVEGLARGVFCSVHLIDDDRRLRLLAAPSLPPPVASLIDGLPIGAGAGVCGMAAFRGEPVLVEDVANDPLCADVREIAAAHDIAACWSSPIKLKDGKVVGTLALYYREKGRPTPWHEQIVPTCLHLATLAIERQASREHIARLAYHDSLTGLPNRRQMRDRLQERIEAVGSGGQLAFLCLDIDRFKDVNDTLGHATGDRLLVEVGRRISRLLGPNDLLGRYGGDEFVLVLADYDTSRAGLFVSSLLQQLRVPMAIDDMLLPVSASIGIGVYPDDGTNEEILLKHADTAMYEAKNAGGDTFRFFRPEMNRMAEERLLLGAALREAIDRRQLRLNYQPQVDCRTGALAGAEALARWRHPQLGEVSPGRFIPLAEELGLIEEIGRWALEEACGQLAGWRRAGLAIPSISVNLSAKHFRDPELTGFIAATLAEAGLEPQMLTVEITEGVIMDGNPVTIETAKAIHALGVKLSLDDFGTGYSSLSYLARLPIDELKIDRGFMQDLARDKNAQAVVTAVVRIGQSLSLTVVAEGVETVEQQGFLEGLSCNLVQGFLVSPALAPADFEAWCRNEEPRRRMGIELPGAA
jgi:diguanylate cyclase (GGDEF)-like protein/PAS domain S-box-containing protein